MRQSYELHDVKLSFYQAKDGTVVPKLHDEGFPAERSVFLNAVNIIDIFAVNDEYKIIPHCKRTGRDRKSTRLNSSHRT